jgi:hypothetical protein
LIKAKKKKKRSNDLQNNQLVAPLMSVVQHHYAATGRGKANSSPNAPKRRGLVLKRQFRGPASKPVKLWRGWNQFTT